MKFISNFFSNDGNWHVDVFDYLESATVLVSVLDLKTLLDTLWKLSYLRLPFWPKICIKYPQSHIAWYSWINIRQIDIFLNFKSHQMTNVCLLISDFLPVFNRSWVLGTYVRLFCTSNFKNILLSYILVWTT